MSIAGALVIAGGATFAYFTDTVTSAGNSFAAGKLDINLRTDVPIQNAPFKVTGMMPGETAEAYFTVVNDGTVDMQWRAYISSGDGGALFGALRVKKIILNPSDYEGYDALNAYTLGGPGKDITLFSGTLPFSVLLNPKNGNLEWDDDKAGPFKPNWASVYKVVVEMDPNADNTYNGKSWSGDLKFEAFQTNDDSAM